MFHCIAGLLRDFHCSQDDIKGGIGTIIAIAIAILLGLQLGTVGLDVPSLFAVVALSLVLIATTIAVATSTPVVGGVATIVVLACSKGSF